MERPAIGGKIAQISPAISKPKEKIIDKYQIFNCNYDLGQKEGFEFVSTKESYKIKVKGRLKANLQYWQSIGCNETILSVIRDGYVIPFLTTPPNKIFSNNKSAMNNSEFVNDAVLELLKTDRIKEVTSALKVVNPLSVSTNGEKNRLNLDLRHVNKHIYKEKIKFEDWKTVREFLSPQVTCLNLT